MVKVLNLDLTVEKVQKGSTKSEAGLERSINEIADNLLGLAKEPKEKQITGQVQIGRLFVETEPKGARVRILNIKPKFYQGMELDPGSYHIEVTARGYEIKTQWIKLGTDEERRISINLSKKNIAKQKSEGEVTRGWLGVAIQDLTGEMAEYYGLKDRKGILVADVFKGDPADKAGIQPKDIILEVNDKKIETSRQLTAMIADLKDGEVAKVVVFRNGKIKIFQIKLAKRDDQRLASRSTSREREEKEFGIGIAELTPEINRGFGIGDTTGVIVIDVESDGKGAAAGIQIGDIIKEINHRVIESVKDYAAAMNKMKDNESVNLFIWRKNAGFLVIKLNK
jgi:serine protease Do